MIPEWPDERIQAYSYNDRDGVRWFLYVGETEWMGHPPPHENLRVAQIANRVTCTGGYEWQWYMWEVCRDGVPLFYEVSRYPTRVLDPIELLAHV